ncbi:MAG: GNAT family N-acetyltransferase [Coriobacteriia bacterium]|nr:GNAT family N-acetyltransferase [Coriobacteriia bacterium]
MDYIIRTATIDDAEAMLAIYEPYVVETAITFETVVPSLAEFRSRVAETIVQYPWIVAEGVQEGVVGYAYAGPFKRRAAYDWSVETSIYLRRDIRGRGLGRRLYQELERILQSMGIRNLNACIACTDRADDPFLSNESVLFHEKLGYTLVGTFHSCGFKLGRWYDMLWMEKTIGAHDGAPTPIIPFSQL